MQLKELLKRLENFKDLYGDAIEVFREEWIESRMDEVEIFEAHFMAADCHGPQRILLS